LENYGIKNTFITSWLVFVADITRTRAGAGLRPAPSTPKEVKIVTINDHVGFELEKISVREIT